MATTAAALLAAGSMLLAAPSETTVAGAIVGPHIATTVAALPRADRLAADATLALVIYEHSHLGTATAMVVAPGDLAVTTTQIPEGASVLGLRPGHRSIALTVVGSDRLLGVTVLRLPSTIAVTPTAPLAPAVETGGGPTSLTGLTAVRGADTPVEFQYAAAVLQAIPTAIPLGRSTIAVTHGSSLVGVVAGSLILDSQGRAVAASVPALGSSSFVPAAFLKALAQRIVLGDTAGHGWLQLNGPRTASSAATVQTVERAGVSWGLVKPHDTIVAIDSQRVRSMADVGSQLYTSSPGQLVQLTLVRNGHLHDVVVRLAASP